MANKHASLNALFTDIADAIREKIGDFGDIPAVEFPNIIMNRLYGKHYITFSSPSSFTLKTEEGTKHWDGILEYSTDTSTWKTWNGATTLSSAISGSDNVLYLRGTGNTVITGNYVTEGTWVLTGSNIACIGNIENLLDYATVASGGHPTMGNHCYYRMFYDCVSLTHPPALPATTLTASCYEKMFSGCINLTKSPDLPATTSAQDCYRNMFYNCTSLTQAPSRLATTLAQDCYHGMFEGCTSLTQAPVLPATTLKEGCYYYMFRDCTALIQAPALPATTLAESCYNGMFYGCTALTQIPALPATTLAIKCYWNMFWNCVSIKLSFTKTGEYTIEYRIPTIGAGTYADGDVDYMFGGTGGTYTGTPAINTTYYLSNTNAVVS